nr:PorT family protein [Saprospiraceae bacterium]
MKLFKFTLIAFLLLSATFAYSQIGVRAGVNLASQEYDPDITQDQSSIIGLNLGVIYEMGISELLTIQPELHFIQKGAKDEFDELGGSYESEIRLNYLELGIMARLDLLDFGNDAGLYVGITPNLGYALSGKTKSSGSFGGISFDDEEDIDFDDDGIERLDFGIGLGAGVNFGNFFIDARYNLGLADIVEDDDLTVNNKGILVGVGYKF